MNVRQHVRNPIVHCLGKHLHRAVGQGKLRATWMLAPEDPGIRLAIRSILPRRVDVPITRPHGPTRMIEIPHIADAATVAAGVRTNESPGTVDPGGS